MIHILTYGNFRLLDRKIECAYRRRHMGPPCECARMHDCNESEGRFQDGSDWLRRLATDIEALARTTELSPPRRRRAARTVSANSKTPRASNRKKSGGQTARVG